MPEEDDDLTENQMAEDAERDDFASFDAQRYLSERARRRGTYLDEAPDEIGVGRRRTSNDDLPVGSRARRDRLYESRRGSLIGETNDRNRSALWTLLLGLLADPKTRSVVFAGGCFLMAAAVGCCGLVLLVLRGNG